MSTKRPGTNAKKRTIVMTFGLLAAFLTGADGNGCDIGHEPSPQEPGESTSGGGPGWCPIDHHIEVVCEDGLPVPPAPPGMSTGTGMGEPWGETTVAVGGGPDPLGAGCVEVCVPDGMCPPGHDEVWICDEEPCPGEGYGPGFPHDVCLDPNGCFEEPGQCYPTCVPTDPCGPGMHEEFVCELVEPPPTFPCLDPNGCASEPPTEECYPICVDDELCGPGMHEEWECVYEEGDNWGGGGCFPTCVPDGPCPPGLEPNIECEGDFCWSVCEPEPTCPPGFTPETACVGDACWVECIEHGGAP